MIKTPLEHTSIETNGIRLHVVQAGPADGKPVIMLHGFPEFWYGWRNQIDPLVNAGFRLIIPDQRGYNLSEKPKQVAAYTLDAVSDDLIGLIDHLGLEKSVVVGHDWGGAAAWWAASKYPDRIERLAVLNVPHHAALRAAIREDPKQRRRLLYMLFFQLPVLPELLIKPGRGYLLAKLLSASSSAITPEDIEQYRQAWSQPGAITAMLNWYRAARRARPPDSAPITMPTLIIWGKHDVAFRSYLAEKSLELCENGHLKLIDEVGHWVQHEAAETVNTHLIDWLQ